MCAAFCILDAHANDGSVMYTIILHRVAAGYHRKWLLFIETMDHALIKLEKIIITIVNFRKAVH